MLAKTYSYGISGLDAFPVQIEVDASRGLPGTVIVGLPDSAVRESKERVRTAIKNSGYQFSLGRITINLSPADIKKEGPAFDLAIALGVLAATEQIPAAALERYIILGELSLDGRIRPVTGALPVALSIPPEQHRALVLPAANAAEAAVSDRVTVYPVRSLKEVVHFLNEAESIPPQPRQPEHVLEEARRYDTDFSEVKGQMSVKRGLEVAAAGGHNLLMIGPPGSGKTMLARRLPTILPDMTKTEALETTKIHSVMGNVPPGRGLLATRPFRSPHHTSSNVALVGGGTIPKPGEVTLAHHGVLFLDELPEFSRNVLETLRQPLEDHHVTISRAARTMQFPAKFMLVASMNPCPCGYYTAADKECHCNPLQIQRYLAKISGPLLDRIDIHLDVSALPPAELLSYPKAETSETIKARTTSARARQTQRFDKDNIFTNAQMTQKSLRKHCPVDEAGRDLLRRAVDELGLSARAHDKILKVARTIADLAGVSDILPEHLAEAIQYRSLDRNWWG